MNSHRTNYKEIISIIVPRVMMQWNRDPLSPAYGSFDRNFWNYKTLIDFPCATYQQAVLGLSELYSDPNASTPYANQPIILEAIQSGILYWCRIQNQDGSQDEYYQNEHSFCATAFTTFAVARAFSLTLKYWNDSEKNLILSKLSRAAKWLSSNSNPTVQNQMIASMNALYWISKLTQQNDHIEYFLKRRKDVLNSQSPEGWFPEYSGADIGYSFKQLDFLCAFLDHEKDAEVQAAAEKLVEFLLHFLHPDGTVGGTYTSRCTEHVFPFGLEWLSQVGSQNARLALNWYKFHRAKGNTIGPETVDDKYLTYFYLFPFVKCALKPDSAIAPTPQTVLGTLGLVSWPIAGLYRYADEDQTFWISSKRNGVFKWFRKERCVIDDSGYEITLNDKSHCATQIENNNSKIQIDKTSSGISFKISGNAGSIDVSLPLVKWIIPFKWFCRTVLRIDSIAIFYSQWLKKTKIANSNYLPIQFERVGEFNSNSFRWKDTIISSGKKISHIVALENVTAVHSPSSRYFQNSYLRPKRLPTQFTQHAHKWTFEWNVNYE